MNMREFNMQVSAGMYW